MNVLVTGGTGYLGRALVRSLAARGHTPIVFARSATRSELPGTLIDGDVRDEHAVAAAADRCEALCHAAALVSIWRSRREDFDEINIGGLRNVVKVARARGISRVLYTSSFLARPPQGARTEQTANDYQRTKVEANRLALHAVDQGVPLMLLYPGVLYGPGFRTEGNLLGQVIADHLAGRLPGIIGACRTWSYAFIDDVASAHVAALDRGRIGHAYCLGGENVPQVRVFEILRQLTGRPLPRRIPLALARIVGALEEARASVLRTPPRLTRAVVNIFRHHWPLDSSAAIHDLGYRITPLAEGLARTLDDLRS